MPKKFRFPSTEFECPLASHQCMAITASGTQCRRRTVIGVDLCWNHLLKLKHLRIKRSIIPHAGLGLFASDPSRPADAIIFRPKQMIVDYEGEDIDIHELNRRYDEETGPYAVERIENRAYQDGACERSVASNINRSSLGLRNNARLGKGRHGYIRVYAAANIRNGQEILVSYGRTYRMAEHSTRR